MPLHEMPKAVTVFGSARIKEDHPYYKAGVELGEKLVAADYAVVTGGGPGSMEAPNKGQARPMVYQLVWALSCHMNSI